MKRRLAILLLNIMLLLVVGCQKTPDSVRKNMNAYGETSDSVSTKLKYINAGDFSKQSEKVRVKRKNLSLPKTFNLGEVTDLYNVTAEYVDLDFKKKEQIAEYFGLDNQIKWEPFDVKVKGDEGASVEDSKKRYIVMCMNGETGYYRNSDEIGLNSVKVIDSFYLMRGENNTKTINLNGNIVSLNDLVKYANSVYEKSPFEKIFNQRVDSIILCNNGKTDVVVVNGDYSYKGISLDKSAMSYGTEMVNPKVKYWYGGYTLVLDSLNDIKSYYATSQLKIEKEVRVKKVLSLQSAVDLVSDRLSGFSKVAVAEVKPVYLLEQDYKNGVYFGAIGNRVKLRPVYSFLLEKRESTPEEVMSYYYINVDMQTGELTTNITEGYNPQKKN